MLLTRLALIVVLLTTATGPARAAEVDLRLIARFPTSETVLGREEIVYLRIGYVSDRPLRIRVSGLKAAVPVTGASYMTNPSPDLPAGEGEALAWIAYREPVLLDGLRISALDTDWRPLASLDLPMRLVWGSQPASQLRAPPDWVERMRDLQQRSTLKALEDTGDDTWIGLAAMLALPLYIGLQALMGMRLTGRWRIAALLPLILALPLAVYCALALIMGSNLWPLALILFAPLGLFYLLLVAGAWLAARLGARA